MQSGKRKQKNEKRKNVSFLRFFLFYDCHWVLMILLWLYSHFKFTNFNLTNKNKLLCISTTSQVHGLLDVVKPFFFFLHLFSAEKRIKMVWKTVSLAIGTNSFRGYPKSLNFDVLILIYPLFCSVFLNVPSLTFEI